MPTERKSYQQYCGLARALDLVGERWTLLLVRELLLGRRRYSELLGALPGLTTNLLAARLRTLREQGLLRKADDGYELTDAGADLEPVLMELARFGGRTLASPRRGERLDWGWALLSLKRRYLGGLEATLALHVDDAWFTLCFEPAWVRTFRGRPSRADSTLHVSGARLRELLFSGGRPPTHEELEGDPTLVSLVLSRLLPLAAAHQPSPPDATTRWSRQRRWTPP